MKINIRYFIDFPSNKKMQAIFNSYTERTFIFNANYDYVKLDECTMKSKRHGIINELFPGVPSDVNGFFRDKNGMLYFFKKKNNQIIL
jgi:hypothetical protein